MKNMFRLTTLLAVSLLSGHSFAQDTTTRAHHPAALFSGTQGYRTWSIGLNGGVLAPALAIGGKNDFSQWKPTIGYGLYIKNQLTHNFGIQLDAFGGTLEADNSKMVGGAPAQGPYSSFHTDLHVAASLSGVLTVGNINWTRMHTMIQPYISVGGGFVNFNPTVTTTAGASINFQPNGSITDFYVPVGVGLKFNLGRSVNLDLGYMMNFVDGDDIDGYYKAPYLADKFAYGHIGLEFSLGNNRNPQLATHNAPAHLAKELRDENASLRASLAADEQRYNERLGQIGALREELNRMKMDSDGDGVSDYFDKCPGTPSGTRVDGAGCPLPTPPPPPPVVRDTTTIIEKPQINITEEDRRIVNEAIRNLEFDFAKATIRPSSYPSLNRVANILIKKGFSLKLAGHTDNVGGDQSNLILSKNRAESVKAYLVSQGANPSRIEATGYGKSQPIATNKTAEGRQQNRRVEFTLF